MSSSDQIVTECDKGVKKMKQIEELVCLEMLLDFGKMKVCSFFFPFSSLLRLLTDFLFNLTDLIMFI